ncbi:TerC family protein [Selenomonas sp. TAMA-11512]|uniref:TerC family protein n=1 Tax=Selenomonas sp. TAMA-11512 TaxID=3095337 RepID=UPI0030883E3E|nr:TerC family protein [Selenomonas sp. TAMA-11512]
MEGMFTVQWLSALSGIILLDLILSGDNAIIIALACKNLPEHQKRKGIIIGGMGAVVIRVVCTLLMTYLLAIPYLQFMGGVALLYIAAHLLKPEEKGDDGKEQPTSLSAAVRTILIADFVMSVDNILSLAGVANTVSDGKWSLIIVGLLVSVTIVLFGAQFFLLLLKKVPALIYVGSAIVAYASAELIAGDKAIGHIFEPYQLSMEIGFVVFVLAYGYWAKKKSKGRSV